MVWEDSILGQGGTMSRSLLILVTDDMQVADQVKKNNETLGTPVRVYSTSQWSEGLDNQFFRNQLYLGVTPSQSGSGSIDQNSSKVLPFPVNPMLRSSNVVPRMEQLEAQAIESAIVQCRGNLTEASKALGIGRATLYRKVKIYQIDPSMARKKRAA